MARNDQMPLRDLRNRRKAMEPQKEPVQSAPAPDMADMEAQQELIAETIEQGNNELRQIKDNTSGINDVAAATELGAEATEISNSFLSEISETSKKSFGKLSEFAERLKSSFNTEVENAPLKTNSSSDQTIKIINEEQPQPDNPLVGYLKSISEDIKLLRADKKEEKNDDTPPAVTPDNSDELKTMINRIGDQIVKSVDSGFKRTVNVADSISSMLFKYTITAALNFVKMAALVLSMIIAFDVLNRHISHWTSMFEEQYAEFKDQLGSLATPFENIHSIITDLVAYFKSGEYLSMFERLAKGAFDQINYVVQMMMVGLAKLGAAILRAVGANDKADTIEAAAISTATENIGYTPSAEEEATIGRVRRRQAIEGAESDIGYSEKLSRWWNDEPMETDAERKEKERKQAIAANTSDSQFGKHAVLSDKISHIGVTAKKNETSAELLGKHRELLDSRASDVESAYKKGDITSDSYEQLKVEIDRQREFLAEHEKTLLKPTVSVKPAPEPEITVADSINKEERRVEASRTARQEASANYNTQANIVKNTNQTLVQAPRTSSPGPGIGNHL